MCVALLGVLGAWNEIAVGQPAAASAAAANKQSVLHVSRCSTSFDNNMRVLTIWGTIDGSKVELMTTYSAMPKIWAVMPGDYPVQIKHDEKTDRGIIREYEVELTPGKRQTFSLSGLAE
jgi:hypothetical protein